MDKRLNQPRGRREGATPFTDDHSCTKCLVRDGKSFGDTVFLHLVEVTQNCFFF